MSLKELDLAGTQVMSLKLLEAMAIEKLNISQTNISYLEPLKTMKLKELNIKGLNVMYTSHLLQLDKLEKLIVSPDLLSKKILFSLREKGVKVIVEP